MSDPELTPLQHELLMALYALHYRYRYSGEWSFDSTLWSKATFRLARTHDKLRPSPAPGRRNMERKFEQRLKRAAERLGQLELARWRSIRAPEGPAKFALGYKRHKARERDLFLTDEGMKRAEAALRDQGLMATGEPVACQDAVDPTGPVAEGLGGCDD